MRDQLTTAIQQRRLVTFTYQGHVRRVQPAAYGVGNRKGKDTLHGYQVGGDSQRGGIPHWRNFHVEAIESLQVLDEVFGPNPPGFQPRPFPQTHIALAGSPSQPATSGGTGGSSGGNADDDGGTTLPGGFKITEEQAQKAAEVANKAIGMVGKWFKKR